MQREAIDLESMREVMRQFPRDAIERVVLVATTRRLTQLRVHCDFCNGTAMRWGVSCPKCYETRANGVGLLTALDGISYFECKTDVDVLAKATDLRRRSTAKVFMALDCHNVVVEVPDWLVRLM
jgi:hypothetical protein